ncbi:glycerophosphodiester phosphodiesterase [Undibacterium sp. LX40W]|uniref:glycerophosphodiester phosphodiesterase n=1 Tax=Undibacterium nitidum TaxID=2762298 RepID=A0A923HSA5_9BURK|nr:MULTISPECIES: glycerophosphodiester phosphodiesterase [Undibacterium]MBC3881587.1 glycerophosphodiester phosphodiesterase [Undibacterium nitidum]MBC3891631.1 glycerophosphodiester phosphodiesterase [Undibacterium sp. LX40W]
MAAVLLSQRSQGRRRFLKATAAGALMAAAPSFAQGKVNRLNANTKPLLLAHRGASAVRPEHTLAAYAKAIADGADYVEPDLVMTKDGVLVARHENYLSETTDVGTRPEFANRRTVKTIDGETHDGWFVDDFTFAELKQLRAVERLATIRSANCAYNGQFQIPSLEEIIDFVAAESATRGRVIGIIPELKSSTYFASVGLPMEDAFVSTLLAHEYSRRAPIEIQSFEVANLKYLRKKLGRPKNMTLMQLVLNTPERPSDVAAANGRTTFAHMITPAGMREIAQYADVIAPPTRAVIPLGKDQRLTAPTSLVTDAHQAGLLVHVWTFRPENIFLAADFRNDAGMHARNEAGSIAEMKRYIETGIDGFFSDDSALGRLAIDT